MRALHAPFKVKILAITVAFQVNTNILADFSVEIGAFFNVTNVIFLLERTFFKLACSYILSEIMLVATKTIGLDRFSRFDVYWIQTDRQAKYVYR